ncbi:MAG: hypothetical protein ACAI25_05660 [Planctomycetota bacterium]
MTPEDTERDLLPRLCRVVEVTLKAKTNADQATMKNALVATQAWLEAHQLDGDFKAVPLDRAVHWVESLEAKLGIAR